MVGDYCHQGWDTEIANMKRDFSYNLSKITNPRQDKTRATQGMAYAPEWEVVCGCMEDKV
jgi:hypothetical protein